MRPFFVNFTFCSGVDLIALLAGCSESVTTSAFKEVFSLENSALISANLASISSEYLIRTDLIASVTSLAVAVAVGAVVGVAADNPSAACRN